MNSIKDVEAFIGQKKIAVAGVSRTGKRFGAAIMKELIAKNYEVFPVNPNADEINGVKCYKSVGELPDGVGGLLIAVKPEAALNLAKQAVEKGIKNIWLQQGSATKEAADFCRENNANVVYNECILMFAQPTGIHSFHRFLWKLFGKAPK